MDKQLLMLYDGTGSFPEFKEGILEIDPKIFAKYNNTKIEQLKGNMGEESIKDLVDSLGVIVQTAYEYYQNKQDSPMPPLHDVQAFFLGFDANNFYEWAKSALNLGLNPIAVHTSSIDEVEFDNISSVNMTMIFDSPFDPTRLEEMVKDDCMFLGMDDELGKVNFSIMPYLFRNFVEGENEDNPLNTVFNKPDSPSEFGSTIREFMDKNSDLTDYFPRFISVPSKAKLEPDKLEKIYHFFKDKDVDKVIIKGNISAASGHNVNPYIILDTRTRGNQSVEEKIEEWESQIIRYQRRHGYDSAIMIQEMIDTERDHEKSNETTRKARKHNAVGHHIWDKGICYTYKMLREKFDTTNPVDIGNVDKTSRGVVLGTDVNTSSYHSPVLEKLGKYLNLVSPFGAHSFDFVLQNESEKLFALEANPSRVRGDQIGSNFFGGANLFDAYTQWLKDQIEDTSEATGIYTSKLRVLEPEERVKYFQDLRLLWETVSDFIGSTIVYCDESGIEQDTEFVENPIGDGTYYGRYWGRVRDYYDLKMANSKIYTDRDLDAKTANYAIGSTITAANYGVINTTIDPHDKPTHGIIQDTGIKPINYMYDNLDKDPYRKK